MKGEGESLCNEKIFCFVLICMDQDEFTQHNCFAFNLTLCFVDIPN
jgi:hypothetical protein